MPSTPGTPQILSHPPRAVEGPPERSEGERSEPERSGGGPSTAGASPAPAAREATGPEVLPKAKRRRFSAEYRLRILQEADRCTQPGQIGALLRREGLYSSHLTLWRKQRDEGALRAMATRKRGPKRRLASPEARRVAELERETAQLRRKLAKAETIIEFQKKVHELLEIPLGSPGDDESA